MFLWPHSSSEPSAEPAGAAECAGRHPFVLKAHSSSSSRPVLSQGPWGPPGQGVPHAADHPTWAWRTWCPGLVCPQATQANNTLGGSSPCRPGKLRPQKGNVLMEGDRRSQVIVGQEAWRGVRGSQTEVPPASRTITERGPQAGGSVGEGVSRCIMSAARSSGVGGTSRGRRYGNKGELPAKDEP